MFDNKKTSELLVEIASKFIGINYLYGGKSPLIGMDCSGLVAECLESVGVIRFLHASDYPNAQGIYNLLIKNPGVHSIPNLITRGALLFFGHSKIEIDHVAIAVTPWHMIEAGGGTSATTNRIIAGEQNAYVRMRPITHRTDFVDALVLPD